MIVILTQLFEPSYGLLNFSYKKSGSNYILKLSFKKPIDDFIIKRKS